MFFFLPASFGGNDPNGLKPPTRQGLKCTVDGSFPFSSLDLHWVLQELLTFFGRCL